LSGQSFFFRSKEYAIRLHNIIEGITDAIFVLDRKWHLTNLNQAAVQLLGKKRIDLIEKNIWELLPEEVAHRIYQFFRKAKKRKVTVEFEEYFEPQEQWFDISLYPSSDGLAVCFRNVSERRKKDEERKELMEQLIIQNRDLEEFTYIASHSLRAQIANISMLCSAIDNGGLTPSNQEIFDRLFQSSSNLDTIISDLNTILTIKDRGSVLWELVSFQNTYINVLSRLPQNMAPFKKHIRLEIDPEVAIFSVRNYLETLLLQIITNSIRFRAMDKEPDILVKAKAESGQIVVTISDNGRGFDSQKVQKQLFQLYKTFHPGLSGKGLGLYLSKILADELQAIISIESHPNTGTKVAIHFPI
ncbi:MAG TPA: PAS domain-containing sensor histidine kinase, partial [Catalimonadaceae bacterium]|nr:PAS domain-containing sensor histidine kinase [Catalimonadaceae bacterium]